MTVQAKWEFKYSSTIFIQVPNRIMRSTLIVDPSTLKQDENRLDLLFSADLFIDPVCKEVISSRSKIPRRSYWWARWKRCPPSPPRNSRPSWRPPSPPPRNAASLRPQLLPPRNSTSRHSKHPLRCVPFPSPRVPAITSGVDRVLCQERAPARLYQSLPGQPLWTHPRIKLFFNLPTFLWMLQKLKSSPKNDDAET